MAPPMEKRRDIRQTAVLTLLHNVRRRHTLAQNPFVQRPIGPAELPAIVEELIDVLALGSAQQCRRFSILRRSDIAREKHSAIASDIGLSRSQFYRDLQAARAEFADALEDRLAVLPSESTPGTFARDARVLAIEALRDAGRFERACVAASALIRDSDVSGAIRALCVRAEVETESGAFARALATARQARRLLPHLSEGRFRDVLAAKCDLIELEAAHCQGTPGDMWGRTLAIDRLRRSQCADDGEHAALLARALVEEGSILFERDRLPQALASIEEASAIVSRERFADSRLAVDVRIRVSGMHALEPDRVSTALDETIAIAESGRRCGNVRTLRVGMQMMAAHLLTLGRLDEARHYALESWALIDLFGSALDRTIVLSNLARIDVQRRDGIQALRWIRMAPRLSCDAFSITHALAITEAEALLLLNQAVRAADLTRALNVRVRDWPRLAGRAKLAHAVALSAIGREREARECSQEAVELSRGAGGLHLHLRALDINVKLTGNVRSRRALRDLRAELSA